ncbi:riboflavin synthase [Gorillibacterium timonense]|uniref:riboflavin synthase n=1 Tax=Gorillibacterium timonense TaxID=1689269 RepID=UPI00071E2BD8|nr:riboflavin synthase [Gorillibacterium timonense]
MFTGIIEEIGTMKGIKRQGQALVLTVGASRILEDVHLGDSIAVNGVCLTVISFDAASVSMDVMPETYRKTSLRLLQPGSRVNLERAMAAGGRYGGHMVQGHVDTTGTIRNREREENAVVYTIEPEKPEVLRYIIPQGSVAIDGISLTVVDTADRTFTVSIIPHTLQETILADKYAGDTVNLECDILGKYIERLLRYPAAAASSHKQSGLTEQFLAENGFL